MNVLASQPEVLVSRLPATWESGTADASPVDAERFFEIAMEKVDKLSQKLVASAFLVPMLDRMQEDPLRSDLMHGGFAENAFQSQLNTRLADAVAEKMQTSVTRSIRERISGWVKHQPDERLREIGRLRIDTIG